MEGTACTFRSIDLNVQNCVTTCSLHSMPMRQCAHAMQIQSFKRTLLSISIKFVTVFMQRALDSPFRPPVKNIFTMNTCNAAIATINPPSIKLKLNILLSVLFTVLKFLFSRVRKYFCCRVSVEIWLDNLSTVSSTPLSCSVDTPAFWGRLALNSFSTCESLLENRYNVRWELKGTQRSRSRLSCP